MSTTKHQPDMRAEVEITLDFPVELDGDKTTSLKMRRPKVSDTIWGRKQSGDDYERTVRMAARLCDVQPEVIELLDELDMAKIDHQYGRFRGDVAA